MTRKSALTLAAVLLAGSAIDRNAQAQTPPGAVAPAWMEFSSRTLAKGEVGSIHRALAGLACQPRLASQDPVDLQKFPLSNAYRINDDCSHIVSREGPNAGVWDFLVPEAGRMQALLGGRRPTIARRIGFPAADMPYRVKVTVYCEQDDGDCRQWQAGSLHMAPPSPASMADPGSKLDHAWEELVAEEPCIPAPAHTEPPDYPREALNEGITGTVYLLVVVNHCGEVRDVQVENSSHSLMLDQAAIRAIEKSRMDLPPAERYVRPFARVRIPVKFQL